MVAPFIGGEGLVPCGSDLLAFSRRYEDRAAVLSQPVGDALPPGCDPLFLDVLACDNGHRGSALTFGADPRSVMRFP